MFKFGVEYSFKDFIALNKLYAKKMKKWWRRAIEIFYIVAGIIFILIGAVMLTEEISFSWFFVIFLGIILILLMVFAPYLGAIQTKRLLLQDEHKMEFSFEEEFFIETTDKSESKRFYNSIFSLYFYKDRYFIFLDKRHAYIIPKDFLKEINQDEFIKFISEKSEKEWIYVK